MEMSDMATVGQAVAVMQPRSLVQKVAGRFGVDPGKMLDALKATAFKQSGGGSISNEQMMALLIVADHHGLNPFTREIFAFPDKGGIVPVVSVDGWSRILNDHPEMDGVEFIDSDQMTKHGGKEVPEWIECIIYRKDRNRPIRVTEYMSECKRPNVGPWQSHPRRMLRHKAMIQCARLAFGFSGIYDEDEAQRIVTADVQPARAKASAAQSLLSAPAAADDAIVDHATGEVLVEAGE